MLQEAMSLVDDTHLVTLAYMPSCNISPVAQCLAGAWFLLSSCVTLGMLVRYLAQFWHFCSFHETLASAGICLKIK